jgi:plastocyanin
MRVTGLPRWGVRVKPGDVLRSNATYDTTIQSTYENMGIAVTFLAPDLPNGKHTAKGIDPFKAPFDPTPTCASGGLSAGSLCDKGAVTHGHLPEASNFGYATGALPKKLAGPVSQVDIAGFTYLQGDLSLVPTNGIPTVKLGQQLKFVNEDAAAGIYHTITTCAYPCMGPTGISFPLANGRSSLGRGADFDSAELGFGLPYVGPAKNAIDWNVAVTKSNGFDPGSVLTYYCRIHPFMRGAVAVQQ